jgi:hypothetical protein
VVRAGEQGRQRRGSNLTAASVSHACGQVDELERQLEDSMAERRIFEQKSQQMVLALSPPRQHAVSVVVSDECGARCVSSSHSCSAACQTAHHSRRLPPRPAARPSRFVPSRLSLLLCCASSDVDCVVRDWTLIRCRARSHRSGWPTWRKKYRFSLVYLSPFVCVLTVVGCSWHLSRATWRCLTRTWSVRMLLSTTT